MTVLSKNKIAWVYGMILPAVILGPLAIWSAPWTVLPALLLAFATVCLGHTVGLHRGIIHRSYRTHRVVRNALAFIFVLTGLGGPLSWYKVHFLRDHHQARPNAPDHLRFDHGWWRDWVLTHHLTPIVHDWRPIGLRGRDIHDPWLVALERHWLTIQIAQAGLLALLGGWELVVVAWCMRNALVIWGHWFVGYVAHTHGTQRYRLWHASEEGRNTWLLGVLSMGEGFHNNHHAAPSSARIGRVWWEFDLGWYTLIAMEAVGLVWDLQRPRHLGDLLKDDATLIGDPEPEATNSDEAA